MTIPKIIIRPSGEAPLPQKPSPTSSTSSSDVITLPKRQTFLIGGLFLALFLGMSVWLMFSFFRRTNGPLPPPKSPALEQPQGDTFEVDVANYTAEKDVMSNDLMLTEFLAKQNLSEPVARELQQQAENKGLDRFEKGHEMVTLTPKDGDAKKRLFSYKISSNKSMIFKLNPLPEVYVKLEKVENRVRAAGGVIKTSLWEAILDYNIHYRLLEQMEEAMKWSVDFYHLQPGDKFKVIYEEKRAGNEVVGIGKLKAVYFKTGGAEHYAFLINNVEKPGYYDHNGSPVKKPFLKCPVKYERITSFYNPARIHPVTGVLKAHLGTDFGAPQGSPIFSLADGTVEVAEYTSNNGNFVKIRHDNVYETQYLHMERFEEGIQKGSRVQQGQVIGYVGQTGLATGPHVCLRYWKGGVQVDPRNEPENRAFIMSLKDQRRYDEQKNASEQQLRQIVYFDGRY